MNKVQAQLIQKSSLTVSEILRKKIDGEFYLDMSYGYSYCNYGAHVIIKQGMVVKNEGYYCDLHSGEVFKEKVDLMDKSNSYSMSNKENFLKLKKAFK